MCRYVLSLLLGPYLHALLAGFNGGDIPSNAASDDDQVLLLCYSLASDKSRDPCMQLTGFSGVASPRQSCNC
jgi:hypothetical protein